MFKLFFPGDGAKITNCDMYLPSKITGKNFSLEISLSYEFENGNDAMKLSDSFSDENIKLYEEADDMPEEIDHYNSRRVEFNLKDSEQEVNCTITATLYDRNDNYLTIKYNDSLTMPAMSYEGYEFIGWTTELIEASDYVEGFYRTYNTIYANEDSVSLGRYLHLYGIFKMNPKSINVNEEIKICDYEYSEYAKSVNCTYKVNGSSKTEYTLLLNHDFSYNSDSKKADYLIAKIYYEYGTYISTISSLDYGGDFKVHPNKDIVIKIESYDMSGKIVLRAEYKKAYLKLLAGKFDNIEELSKGLGN